MNTPIPSGAIQQQVFAIIARQAKRDPATITAASTLKDLGIASIEAIETIFDMEEHFDITFPDQGTNFDTDTVQSLVDAVQCALAAKSAGPEAAA